jgi:hypothetical protein
MTVATVEAQNVKVDFDPDADFSTYRSYTWIPKSMLIRGQVPEGAPADEEIEAVILSAVDRALAAKGLRKGDRESAEILVNYLGLVSYRILDAEAFRNNRRSQEWIPYEHWKPFYEGAQEGYVSREGALTVDLVEAETNKLLWRGVVTELVKTADRAELKPLIENGVAKLFEQFPPR